MVMGTRFTCDDIYASDVEEFDDESDGGAHYQLMEKAGLVEGALSELTREHQTRVTDNIRDYISAFETDLTNEKKKLTSALAQIKKNVDMRRGMDKKVDIQYQRNIAEAIDNHWTAIQTDHEYKSQIEERRIKDDAAIEEAKRRERALLDEKLRQEKLRAETEARFETERKIAEEAKAVALEAEKRKVKEAADKVASEKAAANAATIAKEEADRSTNQAGDLVRGARNALKIETERQQMYKEIVDKNAALGSNSNLANHGSKIQRLIKITSGTKEKVRNGAQQLTTIFSDPSCPQPISITTFAEKIVTLCTNESFHFFPLAYVIVLVSSKIPLVMNIVLAKLNMVCIYTVPKYIHFVKAEIQGVRNPHGLEEGWAWLARFLNALPANRYTAAALQGFLEVAGFALHRRYTKQFKKLLTVIHSKFLKGPKRPY